MRDAPIELRGIATSLPSFHVDAAETKVRIHDYLGATRAARYERMVDATRIRKRHIALPVDELWRLDTVQRRNDHYIPQALGMGEQVGRLGLAAANVPPEDVSTIVSASCTGYMLPALDAQLSHRLGLSRNARRVPLTELGCSAGVGGIGIAASLLAGESEAFALLLCVEISSLGVQVAEPSTTDMVANLLFGDGAAAAVLASRPTGRGPLILAARSVLWEDSLDLLGMRLTDFGFRLFLSPALPRLVQARLAESLGAFLGDHGLTIDDIHFWVVHPGGPKIIEAIASTLGLRDRDLRPTWDVWEQYGNLSSATVFFIMKRLQEIAPPALGDFGVMLAFGPGVSCEMVLLQSQGWLSEGRAPESISAR